MKKHDEITISKTLTLPRMCLIALALLVFVDAVKTSFESDVEESFLEAAADRFEQATEDELLEIWHTDCHRRCRYQLDSHIEMACRYDPYRSPRIARRSVTPKKVGSRLIEALSPSKNVTKPVSEDSSAEKSPFLSKHTASTFLHHTSHAMATTVSPDSGRRKKRNIVMECCFSKACAWEEYGEYCQGHPRHPRVRANVCTYS